MAYSKQTLERIAHYESLGYEIICGNDWRLNQRPKWAKYDCVRLAQTNSSRHGMCISTVWAVRLRDESENEKIDS